MYQLNPLSSETLSCLMVNSLLGEWSLTMMKSSGIIVIQVSSENPPDASGFKCLRGCQLCLQKALTACILVT